MFTIIAVPLLLGLVGVKTEPWSGPTFSGEVHFQGLPVAGATVWLIAYPKVFRDQAPEWARTSTNAQGRFTLPCKNGARWVVARDAKGHFGWLVLPFSAEWGLEPALRVDLFEPVEARGKLVGPDGKPLRATILLQSMSPPGPEDAQRPNEDLWLPAPFAKEFQCQVADDGTFVFRNVPARSRLFATIQAPGYEGLGVSWHQEQPLELRLDKPGEVHIRFVGIPDPRQLVNLGIQLYASTRKGQPTIGQPTVWRKLPIGADGTLTIPGVYPGAYTLSATERAKAPFELQPSEPLVVKSDQRTQTTISVLPLAQVQGRVLDAVTRRGVAGAHVNLLELNDQGHREPRAQMATDSEGRFCAYARPGKGTLSLSSPAGYLQPRNQPKEERSLEAGSCCTFADLALQPAQPVEGIVQDEQGRPVPWVRVLPADAIGFGMYSDQRIHADAYGRFTLRTLGPKDFTVLRARTATAVTNGGVPLDVSRQKGPIPLILSEKAASRLHGRIVDGSGKPVADAAVQIEWRYQGVGAAADPGLGGWLETYRTDPQGRFETQALVPGDVYKLRVRATGCGPVESAEVKGEAGKSVDLGVITILRTNQGVSGIVVASDGLPIAGAKVFNEGDAPVPLEMTTNAKGQFHLQGFLDGPVYIFARKQGFRFTMLRTSAGVTGVTVRMLKTGEAVPAGEQPDPHAAAYMAAEQKLTRHLLDRLWALPRSVTGGYETKVFAAMASIDLAQAKAWLADDLKRNPAATEKHTRMRHELRIAEVRQAAETDPDQAITLLTSLEADQAFPPLLALVKRFSKDTPTKALQFLEEAVVKARALKLPDRAWSLAQVGEQASRLGQPEVARKLTAEAADLAEQFGTEQLQGYGRSRIAGFLAPYDLPRARMLVKNLSGSRNEALSEMAVQLAPSDLSNALSLLKDFEPDRSYIKDLTRQRLAVRLTEKDPAEAVRQAEAIPEMRHRARAFSEIAALVGGRDGQLAQHLIDRTFDLYLDHPHDFSSWANFGGLTALAASTGYDAYRSGYPDMASVVARVLATRPTNQWANSPRQLSETLVSTAIVLSLTDPATARQLTEQALNRSNTLSTELNRRHVLFAVALTDPVRAISLVDQRIDEAQKSNGGLRGSDLVELLDTLSAPSSDLRLRQIDIWIGLYLKSRHGDES